MVVEFQRFFLQIVSSVRRGITVFIDLRKSVLEIPEEIKTGFPIPLYRKTVFHTLDPGKHIFISSIRMDPGGRKFCPFTGIMVSHRGDIMLLTGKSKDLLSVFRRPGFCQIMFPVDVKPSVMIQCPPEADKGIGRKGGSGRQAEA